MIYPLFIRGEIEKRVMKFLITMMKTRENENLMEKMIMNVIISHRNQV